MNDEAPRDERAERREQRRRARRDAMRKHGATTGEAYRNAILKRLKQPRRKRN